MILYFDQLIKTAIAVSPIVNIPETIKNRGKVELEKWEWNGELGGCWGVAMKRFGELSLKCGSIDDQIKNLLALALTSCHFQYNPKEFPSQSDQNILLETGCNINEAFVFLSENDDQRLDTVIKQCKQHMTGAALGSFVSMYNHLDNVCFYVNSELWQKKTEQTVERVVTQLAALDRRHEQLLDQADRLKLNLEAGNDNLQIAFGNMQEQVNKESQKILSLFDETFTLVNRLFVFQKSILTRLASFETLLVYALSIILAYYTTTADSTKRSRGAIYFTFSCMAIGELLLRRWPMPTYIVMSLITIDNSDGFPPPDFLIRPWRYTCAIIAFYIWLKAYISYKDPTSILVAKMDALASTVEKTLTLHSNRISAAAAAPAIKNSDSFNVVTSDSDYYTEEESIEELIRPRKRNPPRSGRPTLYRPPQVGSLEDIDKLGLNAMLLFESAQDFTNLFQNPYTPSSTSSEYCESSSSEPLLRPRLVKQEIKSETSTSEESLEIIS